MTTTGVGIAAMAALLFTCGCDGGEKKKAPAERPAGAPGAVSARDAVYGQIPHDTPYLYLPRGEAFGHEELAEAFEELRDDAGPALLALDAAAIAEMDADERLAIAAMRVVAELDDAELERIGLTKRDTPVAFYGYGLVPVVRFAVDGARVRELWIEAARRTSAPTKLESWHGRPYLRFPLGDEAEAVVMLRDDQVAMAIARRAADVLPHLAGEAPPARPLDEAALLRAAGVRGELTTRLDPPRIATLLRDGALASLVDAPAGCGPALAPVIAGLAPMIGTNTASATHVVSTTRIGPAPRLAGALRADARPIAHWPATAPSRDETYMAAGVSHAPFVASVAGLIDELQRAAGPCGADASMPPAGDMLRSMAASTLPDVHGFTLVVRAATGDATFPMQLHAVAGAADPAAVWARIAGPFGLPDAAPALDEAIAFAAGEAALPATIALHRDSISGTLGAADPAALAALRTAPSGGSSLARVQAGPSDDGPPYEMFATLDGDHIVIEYTIER